MVISMKKLYLVARNHMDPSWLRCFEDHFENPEFGGVVRPYSDVEELQILEYMDFAEQYGVKYHIEQSLDVKKFLERNPDQAERFRNLVQRGLLELAGGGETVIDCNLTQGESWVRNHLYSRTYYKNEFDHVPRYAIAPDIFGLPSQMPQFFRSIGYDALIIFDRVMKQNKPFWQGLDGTRIVLDSRFLQPPQPGVRSADCVKLPACRACGGEGCALCEGTGIEPTYNMTRPDKTLFREAYYGNMTAEELIETLLAVDRDEYFVMIVTEEPRVGSYLYGPLLQAAPKYGVEVKFLTFEEQHDIWCPGQVAALRAGNYTEDEVDVRPEGNPVFSGCYSSRIEIKRANRQLEDLLSHAERLAVLARLQGGWDPDALPRRDYPQKKLEALWNKMAFIQFHDCVTGSHCDASYYELQRYIREVRRGAEQIAADAAKECLRRIGCEVPEGFRAAVYFNTDTAAATHPRLVLHAPAGTKTIEVRDTDGTRLPAYNPEIVEEMVGVGITITVEAEVPPLGWRLFLWKACTEAEPVEHRCGDGQQVRIENACFSVTAEGGRICEIFDKMNDRCMVCDCGLNIGTERGDPWGRYEAETDHRKLYADTVRAEYADGYERLIFTGVYTDPEKKVNRLAFTQTVTLNRGEPLVRFETVLDWDGTDSRIFASAEPAFAHTDRLYCEVPFGTMDRGEPRHGDVSGFADEWPTLGFAGVTGAAEAYNLAILKGGFPGARLKENALQLILLRAFDWDNSKFRNTDECGCHTSEFALTAWTGAFADGCCPAKAASYTIPGHTQVPDSAAAVNAVSTGCLLPALTKLPPQLRMSALKWSEDGCEPVVRFWESTGVGAVLRVPEPFVLQHCDTLETPLDEAPIREYAFRPFEIATFRLKSGT